MLLAPVCTAVLVLLAGAARADEPNPYTLGVIETIAHDSNIFRSPDGTDTSSDWTSTTGVIGSVNQQIGRERLKANGEFDIDRFKRNSQLNSNSHSLNIEGDWSTVGNLSGELGYSNSSQLYQYNLDDVQRVTASNTQDTVQEFARFHLGVVTRWTLDALFNGLRQTYSAQPYAFRDIKRYDGSLGTSYQAASLRTSLSFRRTHGQYPNYLSNSADDFTRNDLILGLSYDASGASTLKLNLSKAREDHSAINSRSTHTWSADGQWIWTPTGHSRFTLDFMRDNDTGAVDTLGLGNESDARERLTLSSGLAYLVTSKVNLSLNGVFSRRQLDAAFTSTPALEARGSDRLVRMGLGLNYTPTRTSQLGCNASHERRSVQGTPLSITYPYKDMLLSCSGQISFN